MITCYSHESFSDINLLLFSNKETTTAFLQTFHLLQRHTSDPSVKPTSQAEPAEATVASNSPISSSSSTSDSTSAEPTPVLLITSATLRDYIRDEHHLIPCAFIPMHAQLMNEMLAYTSYRSHRLGVEDEAPVVPD